MAKNCKECGYENMQTSYYCVRCGKLLPGMNEMEVIEKKRKKELETIESDLKKQINRLQNEVNNLKSTYTDKKAITYFEYFRLKSQSELSWHEKLIDEIKDWWNENKEVYYAFMGLMAFVAITVISMHHLAKSCEGDNSTKETAQIVPKGTQESSDENKMIWVKYDINSYALKTIQGEHKFTLADGFVPYVFSKGLSAVKDKSNNNVGYCDATGKKYVIQMGKYKAIEGVDPSFRDGRAKISYNGQIGYIDKSGNFTKGK